MAKLCPQGALLLSWAQIISGWKHHSPKQVSASNHEVMSWRNRNRVWVIQEDEEIARLATYSRLGSLITEPQIILCTWKLFLTPCLFLPRMDSPTLAQNAQKCTQHESLSGEGRLLNEAHMTVQPLSFLPAAVAAALGTPPRWAGAAPTSPSPLGTAPWGQGGCSRARVLGSAPSSPGGMTTALALGARLRYPSPPTPY